MRTHTYSGVTRTPVAHARACTSVSVCVSRTRLGYILVSDAHTSLKREYMYAFVRECTRLAPLMATHCVISTSGRVTPRYKTNDKARQIPLRFESLKSSLVLPISFFVSPTLFLPRTSFSFFLSSSVFSRLSFSFCSSAYVPSPCWLACASYLLLFRRFRV